MAHSSVITASSQVETSYYGQPVIKAPHWRWLIIAYIFLGGMAGASFTISTLAELFSKDRAVARAGRYLSFAAFLPCPPLLILDLGRPERFLNMLRIVKLKSPMSLGSWALSFAGAAATIAATLQLLEDVTHREVLPGAKRMVGILGLPFTVLLSGYTGLLLAATNIPIWWRSSPLLSPTFISSAYSTSLAGLSVLLGLGKGEREETARRMMRAEAICMALELGFLTAALLRLGKIGRPLTTGKLGLIFWPITYVNGILVPLAQQVSHLLRGTTPTRAQRNAMAAQVLIGGFSLRALMIFAGRKSAAIPEHYFELTSRDL
jgi:formate-dependent nitrite reductase membrane component NrfD